MRMLETGRVDSRKGAKIAKEKSFDTGKFAPEIPKSSVP